MCRDGPPHHVSEAAPPHAQPLTCAPHPISRHLDISRDRLSSYYKFKLTRKVLSLFVQKLGNLMSLDISGHMILENCSISKVEEEAGQTRWASAVAATGAAPQGSTRRPPPSAALGARDKEAVRPCPPRSEGRVVIRTAEGEARGAPRVGGEGMAPRLS